MSNDKPAVWIVIMDTVKGVRVHRMVTGHDRDTAVKVATITDQTGELDYATLVDVVKISN